MSNRLQPLTGWFGSSRMSGNEHLGRHYPHYPLRSLLGHRRGAPEKSRGQAPANNARQGHSENHLEIPEQHELAGRSGHFRSGLGAFRLRSQLHAHLARALNPGSGFVILAFFSVFFLDHKLKIWEWAAVAVVTAGIIALGFSEPPTAQTTSHIFPLRLTVAIAIGCAVCFTSYGMKNFFHKGFQWVVVFSIFAGTFLGTGDVLTKAVMVADRDQVLFHGLRDHRPRARGLLPERKFPAHPRLPARPRNPR